MKKLILLDCGLHYGVGPVCRKCSSGVTARDIQNQRNQALVAALEPLPRDIQECGIENASRGYWGNGY